MRYGDEPGRLWFQGHWGFQYYMEEIGARALDLSQDPVFPGELIVVPLNNTDAYPLPPSAVRLVERIQQPRFWVHTMAGELGAGFYASNVGPLPYVIGAGPPDRTEVYEVLHGFTGQLPKQKMPWW